MYENVLLIKDLTGITIKSALDPRLVDIDIFCYNLKRIFNEVFLSDTKRSLKLVLWVYDSTTLNEESFSRASHKSSTPEVFCQGKKWGFFSFSASYLENRSMYE